MQITFHEVEISKFHPWYRPTSFAEKFRYPCGIQTI